MLLRSVVRRSSLLNQFKRRLSNPKPVISSSSSSRSVASYSSSASPSFSSPSDPHFSSNPTIKKSRFLSLLKFTVFGAITGALATAGYATYAYTADEVDEKTKAFRSSINHTMVDAPFTVKTLPQLIYTSVMTVPSKAVNFYLDLRRLTEERMQEFADPCAEKLLPDLPLEYEQNRIFTLVLDLTETLILSEWKRETGWSTFKRPGLDAFLQHLCQIYEIVVYSDKMLDPQIENKLIEKGVNYILQRPATKYQDGKHFRDLSKLNRNPERVLYVSGHALETCLQPENCVPIKPWKKEANDTVLIDLIPFLEYMGVYKPADIREVLANYRGTDIPKEFINRSKQFQRHHEKKQRAFPWSRNSW